MKIGSPEWLEYRNGKIGASDVSAILGISPWQTPLQLYESKVLGKTQYYNKSMRRGQESEEEARRWFEAKHGTFLFPSIVESTSVSWAMATLDGLDLDGKVMLEIKWANRKVHEMARKGEIIDYYYCQCQWQLMCHPLPRMWFLSCFEEEKVEVEVSWDNSYILDIKEKGMDFYHNHLLPKIPPPMNERDIARLKHEEEWKL